MQKQLLCVFIFGFFSAFNADEQTDFFNRISITDFGQTIIETLQLELGQSNAIDHIVNMLVQMKQDLLQDQNQADAQSKSREIDCLKSIIETDAIKTRAEEKRAEDEQQRQQQVQMFLVPLKEEELEDKRRQQSEKQFEARRNQDRITIVTQERQESRSQYEARRNDLIGMLAALREAKTIITQLKRGSADSFLEIDNMTEIAEHYKSFCNSQDLFLEKHYPIKKGFNSLVQLLMETIQDPAIRSDQNLVGNVLSVIDDLIESLYAVQKQEMIADDANGRSFQLIIARYQSSNVQFIQSVATLDANIQVLSQKLLELNNDITTQQQVADNKVTERADWVKTCDDEHIGYDLQSQKRAEQLQIITQTIQILTGSDGLSKQCQLLLSQMKV